MSYVQVVQQLESLGIMPTRMPELAPMQRALERAGLVQNLERAHARSVIVAGTNGKGTTCATLSALLHATGHSVGLYTSPHLVTTRERIRLNEQDITEEDFVTAYQAVASVIRQETLTHFEALTLMAAWIFHSGDLRAPVDYTVWEVGLGGLFDATNAIPHATCVITALGLDHQAILGNSLQEIAAQKFGVVGDGSNVIYSPMPAELNPLREATAARTQSNWIAARPADTWGELQLTLAGPRGRENSATALTTFEALGFDPAEFLPALKLVRWPGRFSSLKNSRLPCPVYLSGDHNLPGVESILPLLREVPYRKLHLIVGIGADKDARAMLNTLCDLPRTELYLTETAFKPLPLNQYPAEFRVRARLSDSEVMRILDALRSEVSAQDLVLVTGSLYLVGKVLSLSH